MAGATVCNEVFYAIAESLPEYMGLKNLKDYLSESDMGDMIRVISRDFPKRINPNQDVIDLTVSNLRTFRVALERYANAIRKAQEGKGIGEEDLPYSVAFLMAAAYTGLNNNQGFQNLSKEEQDKVLNTFLTDIFVDKVGDKYKEKIESSLAEVIVSLLSEGKADPSDVFSKILNLEFPESLPATQVNTSTLTVVIGIFSSSNLELSEGTIRMREMDEAA